LQQPTEFFVSPSKTCQQWIGCLVVFCVLPMEVGSQVTFSSGSVPPSLLDRQMGGPVEPLPQGASSGAPQQRKSVTVSCRQSGSQVPLFSCVLSQELAPCRCRHVPAATVPPVAHTLARFFWLTVAPKVLSPCAGSVCACLLESQLKLAHVSNTEGWHRGKDHKDELHICPETGGAVKGLTQGRRQTRRAPHVGSWCWPSVTEISNLGRWHT